MVGSKFIILFVHGRRIRSSTRSPLTNAYNNEDEMLSWFQCDVEDDFCLKFASKERDSVQTDPHSDVFYHAFSNLSLREGILTMFGQ
ncbi:hypothetical protein KP509_05G001000 [Ceratopteris richardii]|uniref:Uncharacterized protein n=1 Tax=Ceratopteris richardii TaxID=49495 RepID=A0A8T2UIT5_CERRI|nr:hypothetical protein KP509_05G001000 [Ceratopteris richardii]